MVKFYSAIAINILSWKKTHYFFINMRSIFTLFLFPGVITDILGFILLIIPIQNSPDPKYQSSQTQQDKSKSDVIEGEYRREDD